MAGGREIAGSTWVWPAPADRWRKPLIIAASLLLHAAVLVPMALGLFSAQTVVPAPVEPPIYVQMEPRPRLRSKTARAPAPVVAGATAETGLLIEPPPSLVAPPHLDEEAEDAPRAPTPHAVGAPPRDGLSAAWRAGAEALAAGPGRVGPDCRRTELPAPIERELCARRLATTDATAATARPGQRRLTRTESVRQDGFAEQAAANEAWARYRRDEGPYPGLRSMLKHF